MLTRTAMLAIAPLVPLLAAACANTPHSAELRHVEDVVAAIERQEVSDNGEAEQAPPTEQAEGPLSYEVVRDIDPPPDVPAELVRPHEGKALERAQLALSTILDQIPTQDFLPRAAGQQQQESPAPSRRAEPSLEVQRAFVAARAKQIQGEPRQALSALAPALRENPEEPALLRLAGELYLAIGDGASAAVSFRRALVHEPDDPQALYMLGRYLFGERRWDEAIAVFGRASQMDLAKTDPGLAVMVPYFLGMALEREGYDAAAADAHHRLLDRGVDFQFSARFMREIGVLTRQQAGLWQNLGDMHSRIDRPDRALIAYHRAGELEAGRPGPLAARLTYALLRIEQLPAARDLVLDQLELTAAADSALRLLEYLVELHPPDSRFSRELERIYERLDKPERLVMLLSRIHEPADAQALLARHLQSHPGDANVLDRMLDLAVKRNSNRAWREAVEAIIEVIDDDPQADVDRLDLYARRLIEAHDGPRPLLRALDRLGGDRARTAAANFLRGWAYQVSHGYAPDAASAWRLAVRDEPRLAAARIALTANRVEAGEYEMARRWLEPLWQQPDPRIVKLAATVLLGLDHASAADALLQRRLEQAVDDPRMYIAVAEAYQQHFEDAEAALRTLEQGLQRHGGSEQLHAARLDLLHEQAPESREQFIAAIRDLFEAVPQSRHARLIRVREMHLPQQRYDRAARELRALLAMDAQDYEALALLCRVYVADGRPGQAAELLERRMEAAPADGRLRAVARAHLQRHGDTEQRLPLQRRWAESQLDGPLRERMMARTELMKGEPRRARDRMRSLLRDRDLEEPAHAAQLLVRALHHLGQDDRIDRELERLIERFAHAQVALGQMRAFERFEAGRVDDALAILDRLLESDADDAMLLNAAAYLRARAGRELDRAEAMIERAVKGTQPPMEMLDTLGWVRYRQGDFTGALEALMEAMQRGGREHPIILDHLGDTLYRLNRGDQAISAWQAALERLERRQLLEEPELVETAAQLQRKLEAAEKGKRVPITPTVEEAEAGEAPQTVDELDDVVDVDSLLP